ncbi:hypothetical protein TrVE_jg11715 [Triparma verrucosa]|uniref:Uncharacterized protein n=1 Tax=Triparma verrucosa TaxID=1606542 RepID=A0A9W7BEK9_9STRA|nr:hypothetical protein TrVE_jg11715 [Triparma verrucosa]
MPRAARLEHGTLRVTLAQAPPPPKAPSTRKGKTKKDRLSSDSEDDESAQKVGKADRRKNEQGFAITKREQQKLFARAKTDKVRGKFKGLKTKERKKALKKLSPPVSSPSPLPVSSPSPPSSSLADLQQSEIANDLETTTLESDISDTEINHNSTNFAQFLADDDSTSDESS